ncbi:MAG: glutamate-5-semialdehyde dehydrogenase [Myxococcota bacterium]
MDEEVYRTVRVLAERARPAARTLGHVDTAKKNALLRAVAEALRGEAQDEVLSANAVDVEAARGSGLTSAMIERLVLDRTRLLQVADGLDDLAKLPDPVGEIVQMRMLESGLQAGRMRVPLGVIAMIYESRPNVTADAAALCLKSGNAVILRGGSEAFRSNQAIAGVFRRALDVAGMPTHAVQLVPTTQREATKALIGLTGLIDLVIPRGGEPLIRFVTEHATVPVIQHFKGVCHLYVDGDADFDMAEKIALNAKCQRPGVCNAMETLLIDRACAASFLPQILSRLAEHKVEVRGDSGVCALAPETQQASEKDWDTEYLDLTLSISIVEGIDGALSHIDKHGSHHTEAIVTSSYAKARRFVREVDASCVFVNASTRFNDGSQLGLGAEIGISTSKMHAYGPMGLSELCTLKWIGYGEGHIRN